MRQIRDTKGRNRGADRVVLRQAGLVQSGVATDRIPWIAAPARQRRRAAQAPAAPALVVVETAVDPSIGGRFRLIDPDRVGGFLRQHTVLAALLVDGHEAVTREFGGMVRPVLEVSHDGNVLFLHPASDLDLPLALEAANRVQVAWGRRASAESDGLLYLGSVAR